MENKKTYSKNHMMVILEEIKSQGKVAIEQYTGLKKNVDLILEDMDQVKSDVVDIKSDIRDMKVELKMKAPKEIVDNHETRIVKLEKIALANG